MSLLEQFTKIFQRSTSETNSERAFKRFFNPETSVEIRRLQFFWAACIVGVVFCLSYVVMMSFSHKESVSEDVQKLEPKPMETASSKVDLNEGYWHKVEEENRKLRDQLSDIEKRLQTRDTPQAALIPNEGQNTRVEELESKLHILQDQIDEQNKTLSSFNRNLSSQGLPSRGLSSNSLPGGDADGQFIQKVSLNLTPSQREKKLRTVETTIPAGAFAQTVLLSGLDASASMSASSDPRPMLLRLIDPGTLPRRFQSDLEDCHCTASAYGDLSSERVYARLEKLSCIERATREIIETQVAGYISGSDGKAGIRGVVASKDGQFLTRSLVGGVFAGLSNVANPQNRQAQVNPFFPGSSQTSPPSMGGMFSSGMATGATTALDRLSQYYIDRAEQLQPVIQIAAGQVVDIVFTEGISIGSQNIKSEIEQTRNDTRAHKDTASHQDGPPSASSSQTGE